jgi:lactate permease
MSVAIVVLAAFHQVLDPAGNLLVTTLAALVPVVLLLVLLAVFRVTAWLAVLIGSIATYLIGVYVWSAPAGDTARAYIFGSATGIWNVDWITFWGVIIFNTLVVTGLFEKFKDWLVIQATADVRVQAMLLAWAFGALLEGLVGFGYPWAVVAPILIGLGVAELEAIRVAALANNAPVSYGALGAPIIALATVTQLPVMTVGASVGRIVAVLALLPPWVLIYLVSGWRGIRSGWPLAIVGSLAYIAGQFPTSQWLNPYLPDIFGSLVCFVVLLLFLKVWHPSETLGFGGVPIETRDQAPALRPRFAGPGAAPRSMPASEVLLAILPFVILVVVVVLWTGSWWPWNHVASKALTAISGYKVSATAISSISHKASLATFNWTPFIAGTAIFASWLVIAAFLGVTGRLKAGMLGTVFGRTFKQMWGALLVGVFIFGLAYVFNFSGMANSMASGFSKLGKWYLLLIPIVGWIGVALSGSNTSTNTLFGAFQKTVGSILGLPLYLAPALSSVGAEVGKPVAPQTTSVGVSTTSYVRREGVAIRHNMGWTLVILAYVIVIGLFFYFVLPQAMR